MPHGSNSTGTCCVAWAHISGRSHFLGVGTADDAVGSPVLRRFGSEMVHDTAHHYYTTYSADSGSQIDSDLRTDAGLRTESGS